MTPTAYTFTLSDYIRAALSSAQIERLEDGTFGGRVPDCIGVIAFGATRLECFNQLQSVLEDWIWWGLKAGIKGRG